MTDREMEIAQKIGPSAFTIYSYIKRYNRNRDVDIQADLGLSHKTVATVLKKMNEYGIITRRMVDNRTREIKITSEKDWEI
jgi:transposase